MGSEVCGGGGGGLVEVRRSARLREMVETGLVDDRSEGDVEPVKVEEDDEVGHGEMVKVEEEVDVEDEEVGLTRRNRGIWYGGSGGWSVRRSARLRERREAEVVVELDETTGEAYGKLVKLEEMTGLVSGDTCEMEKVEEEVAVGESDDGGSDVEPVGEENCGGEVMVERRARKWKHREYVVLFEAYQERLVEGDKGWQERILDGWLRRGMWCEERKVLMEEGGKGW